MGLLWAVMFPNAARTEVRARISSMPQVPPMTRRSAMDPRIRLRFFIAVLLMHERRCDRDGKKNAFHVGQVGEKATSLERDV